MRRVLQRLGLTFAFIGVLSLAAVLVPQFAKGQASTTASGLRVAPLRTELVVSPGKTDTVYVKVRNVTGAKIAVRSIVIDFRPKDDGSPEALEPNAAQLPTSIKSFLQPRDGVELNPEQEHEYELPLTVPADASPGAYYGLLLFQAVPVGQGGDGPGQVSLTASVGHIVLVEVPGNIVQQMQVMQVRAARETLPEDKKAPEIKTGTLFANAPNQIRVTVRNTGNGFLKPFGNVTIQDWRKNEIASTEINAIDPRGNVFPGSDRVFTAAIDEVKGVGRYTMLASVGYGNGNEVITVTSTFWVLPLWFVGLVAVALMVLVFIIVRLVNRFKRR